MVHVYGYNERVAEKKKTISLWTTTLHQTRMQEDRRSSYQKILSNLDRQHPTEPRLCKFHVVALISPFTFLKIIKFALIISSSMADALCGPSNPLQSFKNHSQVDRSLQQDRLTGARHPPAQVCSRGCWRGFSLLYLNCSVGLSHTRSTSSIARR